MMAQREHREQERGTASVRLLGGSAIVPAEDCAKSAMAIKSRNKTAWAVSAGYWRMSVEYKFAIAIHLYIHINRDLKMFVT